ncbi:MAG TPA: peptide chain release factor N(5)-glutamine methyltransferase [Candidatus Fermentibacter daniensis]|jgi:release factor glutamine methyltransferase|nr:MAG: hypothetical protein AO394_01795 [Candidatus Fermentibacter daniensis]MBP7720063.1 peptide chain release factor N(5)-glutamine methyltransferase [Candidatus Fermentibacter sp.]OQC70597.1 MAG: Release factor glutamine methyltransferase [candidate division Hyd24-12 bacterium ADurb.Bin004]KZD19910.1 MAG: hypothetical protein AO396_07790 [Candidatus Fermentibacter daniensis]MCC6871801.1 peptide chain release factor N(5)-glutamine methyltransferase [Candidatus Fermentibacter sp.]
MTVKDALRTAARMLGEAGCGEPAVDSELLLMRVLGLERYEMHMAATSVLPADRLEEFLSLAAARAGRTPLQHVTGEAWFMGRRFLSSPDALIPRQDTEATVEAFLSSLPGSPSRLLDVGTGSGIIAITLAIEFPECTVAGCDISRRALSLASSNAALHAPADPLWILGDLTGPFRAGFDGIVANLPYIPTDEIDSLEPEVRLADPRESLDGGPDGMLLIRRLIEEAGSLLRRGGVLALEAAGRQPAILADEMSAAGTWASVRAGADLSGRPRWITAVRT